MPLRDAIARAAAGDGGFGIMPAGAPAEPLAGGTFGAARGRFVLWPLANTAESVLALLRAIADGVVPVVIPPTWPRGRLDEMRAIFPRFGLFDQGRIDLPAQAAAADARLALALLTSGSTGVPKVIATSLDALDHGIAAIAASQGLGDIGVTGVILPLAYSFALVNQLLWAVRYERRLLFTAGLALPAETLRQLREADAGIVCLVPHQARLLLRHRFGPADAVPSVRVVNSAGNAFPVTCLSLLRTLFPNAAICNNYGCTEAMPRLTVTRITEGDVDATMVGRPIDGVELRIAGDEPVGPITFRAPSASLGTIDAEGALQPHPAWIPSGDLGRIENGVLHVLGRHDRVVKVFGERISTVEIEIALRSAGALEALVWVGDDGAGGDVIRAVIHADAPPSRDAFAAALGARLPRNLWPKEVYLSPDWPTLDSGKTDPLTLKAAAPSLPRVWP